MLNFDMIAYSGLAPLKSVFLAGDQALVDLMAANAAAYTPLSTQLVYGNLYGSDHYYFYSGLFPGASSAFAIETSPGNIPAYNPNYHRPTDTTGYLDFVYGAEVTRIGVATLAELAGPVPEPAAWACLMSGVVFLVGLRRRR
jgi:Zn-dependent M28 family amino/carboxypeptidase